MKLLKLISLIFISLFLGYGTIFCSSYIFPLTLKSVSFIISLISFSSFTSISFQIYLLSKRYVTEIGKKNIWILTLLSGFIFLCGFGQILETFNNGISLSQILGKTIASFATLITTILFWPLATSSIENFNNLKNERDSFYKWSNLPGTLLATKQGSKFLWVNSEWYKVLGWTTEELLNTPIENFIHPSDYHLSKDLKDVTGQLIRYRHKNLNLDGSVKWVWTRWDLVLSNVDIVYGAARDVTEHVLASLEANTTRAHLENWLTIFPDLLVTITIDDTPVDLRKYLWVSPSCENILGYSKDELKDLSLVTLIHPEDQEKSLKEFQRYDSEDLITKITFRQRMLHKNGEWRWIEWSGVSDHDLKMTYGVGRDVTDMINRQISLEISEDRFRSAMHNAPIGLALVSIRGNWLDINPALSSILGYAKDELLIKTYQDITYLDDKYIDVTLIKDLLNKEITNYQITKRCIHKKGHIVSVHVSVSLVWNGMVPQYFILQIRDLTEELRKQKEIESHIKDLEQFASVAAHQLKSPSRTIYGMAQALLEDYGHLLDSDGKLFIEDIKQDAANMAEIVDGLYRFSKVRTTNEIEKESVSLYEVLKSIKQNRKEFEREDHIIIVEKMPFLHTNKLLMQEVLFNLIDNGLKFNTSKNPTVEISCIEQKYDISIYIKDNGIGIPEHCQNKIFKMFERIHTNYPGTGIGLALAASIVYKLGGSIKVSSVINQGTIFILTFPK